MFKKHTRALGAWLAGASVATLTQPVHAGIKDYEFQLMEAQVKKGDADVAVRLIDKRTGKPVPDAVIFTKRIDMAPDGMPEMAEPIDAGPSSEAGVYHFKTILPMAGNWQLSLSAKVQGESGTLESKLPVKVVP